MNTHKLLVPAVLVAGAVMVLAVVLLLKPTYQAVGSTARGSEYQGTTTSTTRFYPETQLLSSNGTLGSVIITGAAAGVINLYDATTSDITQRAPSMSSSSVLIASFPASAAAGTYTFDRVVFNGLWVSVVGTQPTTTITFRQ